MAVIVRAQGKRGQTSFLRVFPQRFGGAPLLVSKGKAQGMRLTWKQRN